jgi:AcrR family transcriptional regulator
VADAGGAAEVAGAKGERRRYRKAGPARRAQLLDVARDVLAAGGPAGGGMADVAEAAGVSPGLLYHYFPGGRAELVEALARRLLDELCDRVAVAADLPFSPLARLEHALAALVGYFVDVPVAFRLLFEEGGEHAPTGEDGIAGIARVRLVSTLTALLADPGRSADELFVAGTELVDRTLADVGRCLAGTIEPESAWRASNRRARRIFSA